MFLDVSLLIEEGDTLRAIGVMRHSSQDSVSSALGARNAATSRLHHVASRQETAETSACSRALSRFRE